MEKLKQIAEQLGIHHRWLPEGEHAEKIAEWIDSGVCYIEHRGHNVPPLLVFEDGGSMEIPTVRWTKTSRGWCLVSVGGECSNEGTTHYDVCGTVDAIKHAVSDPSGTEGLIDLVDDIEHMIARMAKRMDEYQRFFSEVRKAIGGEVTPLPGPPASERLAGLRVLLSNDPRDEETHRTEIVAAAESVRDAAQALEDTLAVYRDIARKIEGQVHTIKGARKWDSPAESDR
jgi:hypothetical protein